MPMLRELSFPDSAVSSFNYDEKRRVLEIEMEGAWFGGSNGEEVGRGTLISRDWSLTEVREYDAESESWRPVTGDASLKDLAEAEISENSAILRGFSYKSGLWTEWNIHGGTTVYRVAG
jgi:hypothetical protein